MADLSEWSVSGVGRPRSGLLSKLTRTQCAALVRMRWQILSHSLRTTQGSFEFAARLISYLIYGGMGAGLGVGAGVVAYQLTTGRMWGFLPIEFWVVFFIWQMIPIALAAFQEQFDLSLVLRFPVSFTAFYALYLVFSFSDISTIVGALCGLGILIGVGMARPELTPVVLAAVVMFGMFNLVLVRVILAWLDRWLAQRRTREIISALFLASFLLLQLFNPALHEGRDRSGGSREQNMNWIEQRMRPLLKPVLEVQMWLPPGLAARTLSNAADEGTRGAAVPLSALGLWLVLAGWLLGARVRADYRGEELSESPARSQKQSRESGWMFGGSGPVTAIIEKELRTIMRSMPLLYAIGAPLFMVLVFGSVMRGGPHHSGESFALALPLCVGYALLGSSQMVYNNLGTEGHGIQLLFMSPTPIRRVMLAKNLFHGAMFLAVAVSAGIISTFRLGMPTPTMLAATLAWVFFALPANLAIGNIFSIFLPHRTNLGRLKKQRASNASALLSLLVQLGLLGVGGAVFGAAIFLGKLWMAVPAFSVLAAGSIVAWWRVLRYTDDWASVRRDRLIEVLVKRD